MATYYSPLSFFKGGKRKTNRRNKSNRKNISKGKKSVKGGFYPSIMTGVVQNGAYLVPMALRQGYKLMNSKTRKVR
jgi:hypothetical protein